MRQVLTFLSSILAIGFLAIAPAAAAISSWVDLGGGKARLVADFDPSSRELKGAIEVKLENGWSTYWRYPGSTGIPPMFDFSASQNISFGAIEFPTPSLQTSGGARYAGYKKSVVFPFVGNVSANRMPSLKVDMLIGVCEEICIPAKADIEINAQQLLQSDPVAKRVLSFAKLKMPIRKKSAEVSLDMKRLSKDKLEISLETPFANDLTPNLIVEGPSDWYLTPAIFNRESNGRSIFHLNIKHIPEDAEVTQDKLQVTFVSGNNGLEIRD